MMSRLVAPSLLSADFLHLQRDLEMLERSQADLIHCDIMDGLFVPNISFGLPVLKAISRFVTKPLDVHLMIVQPERYVSDFRQAGADWLSVHYEASVHLHRTLAAIRLEGMKAGIVLNPHSPVHLLEDVLESADFVLLMAVNPGFGGQSFIPATYAKIARLKEMILRKGSDTLIEVDGGVGPSNAKALYEAGADILVAGNAVFSNDEPIETIRRLKNPE